MYDDDDDPYTDDLDARDAHEALDFDDDGEDEGNFMRWLSIAFILCAVGGFVALAWYAYQSSIQPISEDEIPLVEADDRPMKVEPEEAGGWQFQHQDKSVYNQLAAGEGENRPVAERLLPAPEQPVQRPPVEELLSQQAQEPVREQPRQPETLVSPEEIAPEEVKKAEVVDTASIMPETTAEPMVEEKVEQAPEQKVEAKPEPKPEPKPVAKPAAAPAGSINAGQYVIQLGAFRSDADADAAWTKVKNAHGSRFSSKQKRVERADLGAKGVFYRLQVGPYGGEDSAKSECEFLQQNKQGCFVVKVK